MSDPFTHETSNPVICLFYTFIYSELSALKRRMLRKMFGCFWYETFNFLISKDHFFLYREITQFNNWILDVKWLDFSKTKHCGVLKGYFLILNSSFLVIGRTTVLWHTGKCIFTSDKNVFVLSKWISDSTTDVSIKWYSQNDACRTAVIYGVSDSFCWLFYMTSI